MTLIQDRPEEPLVQVELALLYMVDNERRIASGLLGRGHGKELDWFRSITVDLDDEPSGVATAVLDARSRSVQAGRPG